MRFSPHAARAFNSQETLAESKSVLRAAMRLKRSALSAEEVVSSAVALAGILHQHPRLADCKTMLTYHPMKHEISPNTFAQEWITAGRRLCFPRVLEDRLAIFRVLSISDLSPGYRGIMEPLAQISEQVQAGSIDLVLVPGLAFDTAGHRLGQGAGHYDRLLASLPMGCVTIGLAYDWQLVDHVPVGGLDQRVQWLATSSRLVDCRS